MLFRSPTTIEDLVDFVVGKLLDLMEVPHQLNTRWADHPNLKRQRGANPMQIETPVKPTGGWPTSFEVGDTIRFQDSRKPTENRPQA